MINLNVKNCSLLIVLFAISTLLFHSCTDQERSHLNDGLTLSERINQHSEYEDKAEFFLLNPNVVNDIEFKDFTRVHESVQKAIFDEMPNDKRLSFWKNKFEEDLNHRGLPQDVRVLMDKFVSEMTVDLMDSETYLSNCNSLINDLSEENRSYFTDFSSVGYNNTDIKNRVGLAPISGDNPCFVRYCLTCSTWPGNYWCKSKCEVTTSGCGFAWWYSCHYTCILQG